MKNGDVCAWHRRYNTLVLSLSKDTCTYLLPSSSIETLRFCGLVGHPLVDKRYCMKLKTIPALPKWAVLAQH